MTKSEVIDWIKRTRIVPVIRANSADTAFKNADALVEGGIDVLEITLTVPGAVEIIRELALRKDVLVGAGTVLDPDSAAECIQAGARFIVSPCLNSVTVRVCALADIVCAPGALTPTEVVAAHRAGGDIIKIFPCDALGGASYIKSLKAPLPHIPLMPTGGVTLETLSDFLAAGSVAVGVGSSLVDPKLSHQELAERAQAFRARLERVS